METIKLLVNILIYYSIFYWIIYSITIVAILYKDLSEHEIKRYNAFIPIVNIFYYFKICNIPTWVLFVPVINIIALQFAPYNYLKQYECKNFTKWIAVLFPYIVLPIAVFTDGIKKKFVYKDLRIKNIEDLEKLENKLENSTMYDDYLYITEEMEKEQNIIEKKDFVDQIEENIINDEFFFEDEFEEKKQADVEKLLNDKEPQKKSNSILNNILKIENEKKTTDEEMIDEFDKDLSNEGNKTMTQSSIVQLEKDLKQNVKQNIKDTSNYKEYNMSGPSDNTIAFGGEKLIEDRIHAKKDELKCPRCGSSLVGAKDFCPGCGNKI